MGLTFPRVFRQPLYIKLMSITILGIYTVRLHCPEVRSILTTRGLASITSLSLRVHFTDSMLKNDTLLFSPLSFYPTHTHIITFLIIQKPPVPLLHYAYTFIYYAKPLICYANYMHRKVLGSEIVYSSSSNEYFLIFTNRPIT